MKKISDKKIESLLAAVLALKNFKEARQFFRDLLTEAEITEFANRWQAACMLNQNIPYTTIRGQTGLSSRTIARISSWLQNGKGGYRLMLNRISSKHHRTSSSPGKRLC